MQLFVLGMHRSGTSAVTRILNMMGAYFGPEGASTGANIENPKGFWERRDVRDINDRLLHSNGYDWNIVAEWNKSEISSESREHFLNSTKKLILELDAHRPWVIKEPRNCLTFNLWEENLEVPVAIIVFRNPIEVALSLEKRNNFSKSFSLALWGKYYEQILENTKNVSKVYVNYNSLIKNPYETVTKLYSSLKDNGVRGLDMPRRIEIDSFIDNTLYRSKIDSTKTVSGNSYVDSIYKRFIGSHSLEDDISVASKTINQEILELYERSYNFKEQLDHVADELKNYKQQIDDYKQSNKEIESQLKVTQSGIETLKNELFCKKEEILRLIEKRQNDKVEITNLKIAVGVREKELKSSEQTIVSLKEKEVENQVKISSFEDVIRKQEDSKNSLAKETSSLKEEKKELEVHLNQLLASTIRNKQILQKFRDELEKAKIKYRDELNKLKSKHFEQARKIDDLQSKLAERLAIINRLSIVEEDFNKYKKYVHVKISQYNKDIDKTIRYLDKQNKSLSYYAHDIERELRATLKSWRWKIGHNFIRPIEILLRRKNIILSVDRIKELVDLIQKKVENNSISVTLPKIAIDENSKKEKRINSTVSVIKQKKVKYSDINCNKIIDTSTSERCAEQYKINIITPSTNIHGGTKRLLMISSLLSERGHDVKLIRQYKSRAVDWFEVNFPVLDIHFDESTPLLELEDKIPSGDILLTYGNNKANELLGRLSDSKGLKFALFMHFGVHDKALDIKNATLSGYNLVSTTNWIANEIKKYTTKGVHTIGFGVHNDQFYPTTNEKDFCIGALFHKDDWKRSKDVIEAFNILRKKTKFKELKLRMFGQVLNPKLPEGVEYFYDPPQEKLRDIYSSCFVWIMPSLFEGIGMCAVEAMLCGTPLITVPTGGGADFCDTSNSYIVEKKSPNSIAKAVEELYLNKDKAERLRNKAYNDIQSHSWGKSIDKLQKSFYESIYKYFPTGFRNKSKTLTIGIPVYNQLDYVRNCINSLLKNTLLDYELIIVDDNSEIETQQYLESLERELESTKYTYIRNESQKGFPANCNTIIRHANGRYICLLNSDTVVTKSWDKHLVDPLKSDSNLMMVGPSTSYGVAKNYNEIAQQLDEVHHKRFEMSYDDIQLFAENLKSKTEDQVVYTEYVNGFCMMLRKEIVSKIGFFDTNFGLGSREEVQYVDRIRLAGYEVGWVKNAYVHHYGHRSFDAVKDSKGLWEKNKELYFATKNSQIKIGINDSKILFVYSDRYSSSTRKRTFEPIKYIREYFNVGAIHWTELDEQKILDSDILILQRIGGLSEKIKKSFYKDLCNWKNKHGKKIKFVYDTDDYIINAQNQLPTKLMKMSELVLVSTTSLKSNLTHINNNIEVIQNGFDYDRFLKNKELLNVKSNKIKVLCFSIAGAGAETINKAAKQINETNPLVEFHFVSNNNPLHTEQANNLYFSKFLKLDDLFELIQEVDYIVNIGEHSNEYFTELVSKYNFSYKDKNKFINSKSGLKYHHAAISKSIFLTTDTPTEYQSIVENGVNGFFISNSSDIVNVIYQLEGNKQLKDTILQNAYRDAISKYTLRDTVSAYMELFVKLN